jgi:hypothetical protein
MASIKRQRDGVQVQLRAPESALLRRLVSELGSLLESAAAPPSGPVDPLEELTGLADDAPSAPPDDPVLARLFPDGYRDNPEAAAEFRRLTQSTLRQQKSAAAAQLLDALPARGGKVQLGEPAAEQWLGTLNDLRLMLGTRLGVTEDGDPLGGHAASDPDAEPYLIYHWLTAVQDQLITALGG